MNKKNGPVQAEIVNESNHMRLNVNRFTNFTEMGIGCKRAEMIDQRFQIYLTVLGCRKSLRDTAAPACPACIADSSILKDFGIVLDFFAALVGAIISQYPKRL